MDNNKINSDSDKNTSEKLQLKMGNWSLSLSSSRFNVQELSGLAINLMTHLRNQFEDNEGVAAGDYVS